MVFCALVTAGRQQIENKTPIHIADLQSMTEDLPRRLRQRPGSHDDDAGGVASTVAREVGIYIWQRDWLQRCVVSIAERAEDAVNTGRRVRKQRVLTKVSFLGEMHQVDSDHIPPLLQEADCILMSDSVQYREPKSYQVSLRCVEAAEWRTARSMSGVLLSSEG